MDAQDAKIEATTRWGESPPYSSKIIKAGALLADTKTLLAHCDTSASEQENLDRFRRENLFGKSSRSRRRISGSPCNPDRPYLGDATACL